MNTLSRLSFPVSAVNGNVQTSHASHDSNICDLYWFQLKRTCSYRTQGKGTCTTHTIVSSSVHAVPSALNAAYNFSLLHALINISQCACSPP